MRRRLQATTFAEAMSIVSDSIATARHPEQVRSVLLNIAKLSSWRCFDERSEFPGDGVRHTLDAGSSWHTQSFQSGIRRVLSMSEDPRFVMEEVLLCARHLEIVSSREKGRREYSITITQRRWDGRVRVGSVTDIDGFEFHSDRQPQRASRQVQSRSGGLMRPAPTASRALNGRPSKSKSAKKGRKPASSARVRGRSVRAKTSRKDPTIRDPKN